MRPGMGAHPVMPAGTFGTDILLQRMSTSRGNAAFLDKGADEFEHNRVKLWASVVLGLLVTLSGQASLLTQLCDCHDHENVAEATGCCHQEPAAGMMASSTCDTCLCCLTHEEVPESEVLKVPLINWVPLVLDPPERSLTNLLPPLEAGCGRVLSLAVREQPKLPALPRASLSSWLL